MGNVYNAHNVASYFIYELNELHTFINCTSLQHLLNEVDNKWGQIFGHSIYSEHAHSLNSDENAINEVLEAYQEHGDHHITLPAKEWHLEYGKFQLVYRTYGVPNFTEDELKIINEIIIRYHEYEIKKVS